MDKQRGRWNHIVPTVPNEVCGYVSGQLNAVERLRWQEQYLRTGSAGGSVKILTANNTRNRNNTIFTALHTRYNVVLSVVFPPLIRVDARTGQCLFDRTCISVSRFLQSLSGMHEVSANVVGGHKLPAPPSIRLTVLIHQGDHASVDCLCQDTEVDLSNVSAVIDDLMGALNSAEQRAFTASRELRKACPTGRHNPYHEGSILDILDCASQRIPNADGTTVFAVITDFSAHGFCSGAVVMSARERVALADAQLVLIHVGSDVSQLHHIHTLANITHGVLVDWDFIDQTGTRPGTVKQPERMLCAHTRSTEARSPIWNYRSKEALQSLIPVVLAAVATCHAVYYPSGDAPSPDALFKKLRKAVLCRMVTVISKEGNIGLPWPIDTFSDCGGADSKQETLGRVLVGKWSLSVPEAGCLLECRVREGWTVLNPYLSSYGSMQAPLQAAISWATGRTPRWGAVSLLYEVAPLTQTQLSSLDPLTEVSVWAYGPRSLVVQYELRDEASRKKKEEGPSKDVHRLQEFLAAVQCRDQLISTMLKERVSTKERNLTDKIVEHSSDEGCSMAWILTSDVCSYTALLSDTSDNEMSYSDSLPFERQFDSTSFVVGIMQKWPSGIAHITDSAVRAGFGVQRPYVRRVSGGGVLVAQFFIQKVAQGQQLPVCIEVRVSFFSVTQSMRKSILTDLKRIIASDVPMSVRMPGTKARRYHQRNPINIIVARDQLAVLLRDVTSGATEQLFLESVLHDTSDTDAYQGDQQKLYPTPVALRKTHRHKYAITPLSYQYTHRTWEWELPEGRNNQHVFSVLVQVRSKQGYILVHSKDTPDDMVAVMYNGEPASRDVMVIYMCRLSGTKLAIKVWVEQSSMRRTGKSSIASSTQERLQMLEKMYLGHNVVIHSYSTFVQLTQMMEIPNTVPTVIQHARPYMRTVAEHKHRLYDILATTSWVCVRCRKRQSQSTQRWHCTNCTSPQYYDLCHVCMMEIESPALPYRDEQRFSPQPGAPPTDPLWRRYITPQSAAVELLRLPQIDLILRGGYHKLLVLPCFTDPAEQPSTQGETPPETGLSEPLAKLLEALQDGAEQHELLTRAKGVLAAPDTPTIKRAKALLGSDPWRLKAMGTFAVDLTSRMSSELRTQLLAVVEKKDVSKSDTKSSSRQDTSSVGGDDDRWGRNGAPKQLYSRVLNCIKLLCTVQIDVSQSDFPGGQYPRELIPAYAPSLALASTLHCYIRHSDMARSGDLPVTSLIVTVLPSLDSAKPVQMNDTDGKPTRAFAGVVHEVAHEHLKWDVLDDDSADSQKVQDKHKHRSPRTGSAAFKKFLELSHKMMFSFGVYRMLQCSESVSVSDVKRALSACVDYVSEVDITDLVSIFTTSENAIPHEEVNTALKSVLDKNFGPVKGTECHYFFRGRTEKPSTRTPTRGNRPSAPSSRVTIWPRVTASIASSAAAPPSVTSHRPANEGLTTSAVAQIPSATGLPLRPPVAPADQLCEFPSFSDKERTTQLADADDATSFPSASSINTSTEGLPRPDCDSPRLGDGQSRLDAQSACFDSESEESVGVGAPPGSTTTPNPTRPTPAYDGDDLPLFLMMTVTYEVSEPGKKKSKSEQVHSYVIPVNHCILDPNAQQPKLPVSRGTLQKATLSLIAASIPSQYFELSEFGFRPTRREAIRRCMVEVPGTEFRRFSRSRDAYIRDECMKMGPQPEPGDPYQFFPHRPKKLMERTMRRVQAEVHKAQLESQLNRPMFSEPPASIARRMEFLRPKTWSKVTLKLLVLGDPSKKSHMRLYFREWLAESPELRISKLSEDVLCSTLVMTIANTQAEDAAISSVACILAAIVGNTLNAVEADTRTSQEQILPYWLLLKLINIRPVHRGPGGVHGLGMDKSIIKLRLWLHGPELQERQHTLAKVEKSLRATVLSMNKALLLEDCYALNPHCISDLLVPPDMKQAIRYIAVKTAVCVAVLAAVQKRMAPSTTNTTPTTTPQGSTPAPTQKPRGKPASVIRPPSVTGESVQSFSQTPRPAETAPPTGWLVPRSSVSVEPWERWGGLACRQYIVAEQYLGIRTEAADVDACFFHVWNNWQCDNRVRTYLWRGGKDEVYYFQFKLTEFVDYTPYKLVAVAGAAIVGLAVEHAAKTVECLEHVVLKVLSVIGAISAAEATSKFLNPSPPPLTAEQLSPTQPIEKTETAPPSASQEQQQPILAHDVERGRLRATMMIYSVRAPADDIVTPLSCEFKGCMRSATVVALGRHLQKSGGKLTQIDLVELQQRAERSYELMAVIPDGIACHRDKVLGYTRAHMKKWATQVSLNTEALPDTPMPHFIYPRVVQSTRGGSASTQNNNWLACLHVALVETQRSELSTGDWGCLRENVLNDGDSNEVQASGDKTDAPVYALKFLLWMNGDTKELDPAVLQLKEALQGCVVQVFCETSIEDRMPELESFTTEDFEVIQKLCAKAQGQGQGSETKWGSRRRMNEKQWESCVQRMFDGTIQPSLAASLTHDVLLFLRDLHSRSTNEPARNKQTSLQPVAFYAVPCSETIVTNRDDEEGTFSKVNDDWSHNLGSTELSPLPDFALPTLKFYHDRVAQPPVDFYILCGRGSNGEISEQWSAMHSAQCPEDANYVKRNDSSAPAEPLRYYDGEESVSRPCLLAIKVSGEGIGLVSYNFKGEFMKGVQSGVTSIVTELQKRVLLQASVLHQKMGLFLPGQNLFYPQESLLFRDHARDAVQAEVGMSALEDVFTTQPYNKEVLETAFSESVGRGKMPMMGGRGTPMGKGQGVPQLTRRQSSHWMATQGKSAPNIHSMLLGVGGVSARAALVDVHTHGQLLSSGKMSSDLIRHLATFKDIVAAENQAAQQLRARDAVRRDVTDFREAIQAQWPSEKTSCLLYYPVSTSLSPQVKAAIPSILFSATLSIATVSFFTGSTPQSNIKSRVTLAAAVAGMLLAAIQVELMLPKHRVDPKYQKIITGRCVGDTRHRVWPAYYVSRSRLKGFIANCIRMRQSSRLYHCQRVPFLLNEARTQLLLGNYRERETVATDQVPNAALVGGWKQLLSRFMRDYVEYLTSESEKKLGGVLSWVTACVNIDELVSGRLSSDDEMLRSYMSNCARLQIGDTFVSCSTMSFFAVTEISGGVLMLDLSVRESCFALEFYLIDAAANASRQALSLTETPPQLHQSHAISFHKILALIRAQLHMNSMFYDFQMRYMHKALRDLTPPDPKIDLLGVLEDSVLLYERPPLYSVSYLGRKKVSIMIPHEIITEIDISADDVSMLTADECRKALGRFFAYVCRQATSVVEGEEGRVALLMFKDNFPTEKYDCNGMAVVRLDHEEKLYDGDKLVLPLDVYLVCAADSLSRDTTTPLSEAYIECAYKHFKEEVKKQCDDTVRNYKVHRLWKRLMQQKITGTEVMSLLGRSSCSIEKRSLIPDMDPVSLHCLQDVDVDTWLKVCEACCARHTPMIVFSPQSKQNSVSGAIHWIFAPKNQQHPNTIILEFILAPKKSVTAWWCAPRASSEHPAALTPAPVLRQADAHFFTNWVEAITETIWAIAC